MREGGTAEEYQIAQSNNSSATTSIFFLEELLNQAMLI